MAKAKQKHSKPRRFVLRSILNLQNKIAVMKKGNCLNDVKQIQMWDFKQKPVVDDQNV